MRQTIILIFVFVFSACHSSVPNETKAYYPLLQDFHYSSQPGSGHAAFQLDRRIFGGKIHPVLIQRRSGEIAFFLRAPANASLKYRLRFHGRNAGDLDPRIRVETDPPGSIKREFVGLLSGPEEISLSQFANRIVRITFAAREGRPGPIGGALMWIDPIMEYKIDPRVSATKEEEEFRSHHRTDNVLIVLFDAASPFHLATYGYNQRTTPTIDEIASQSVVFENAVSQAAFTHASIGTLFTGLYPHVHGTGIQVDSLAENYRTMAEVFRDAGYRTGMFSGNPLASPIVGYGQGFEKIWTSENVGAATANTIVRRVNSWLRDVRNERFFGYIHFREPHEPYNPPVQFRKMFFESTPMSLLAQASAAYNGNLAFVDSEFGRILDELRSLGLYDHTILVLLADHGEAFGEHGLKGHVRQVYEEMIRIPLILHIPREESLKGIRKREVAGIIDLMPTFVDLFPVSAKGVHFNGSSLLPVLLNHPVPDRFLVSYCRGAYEAFSLRSRDYKYIRFSDKHRQDELYYLPSDPHERNNLISLDLVHAGFCRMELSKKLEDIRRLAEKMPRPPTPKIELNEQTKEQLRALGYIQ